MLTIHLRINDESGQPTPVRLRLSGLDEAVFAPFSRSATFPTGAYEAVGGHLQIGSEIWHTIDGSCEVKLPAGVPIRVRASKGPAYIPLDEVVTLGSGQMALRFTIRRWSNIAESGWLAGDARAHAMSPHDAALDAAAEGLDLVQLLATIQEMPSISIGKTFPMPSNIAAFSGQRFALDTHGVGVVVNTFNVHPVLGRVSLLHSHRPVYPLRFGDEDGDDWSICDWCDQCHRKRGLTVWSDAFEPAGGVIGGDALAAALLGKIDAVEVSTRPRRSPLLPWVYRLWNLGFDLPLIGGSGKDANTTPLGYPRTVAQPSSHEESGPLGWIEAVRSRRCSVTNGPLLISSIEPNGDIVSCRAVAESIVPFEKLELVQNGSVIESAATTLADGRWTASGDWSVSLSRSGWFAFRCTGGVGRPLHDQPTFAHTPPTRVRIADQPPPPDDAARTALRRCLDQTCDWIETHGRFPEERRKVGHLARIREAMAVLDQAAVN